MKMPLPICSDVRKSRPASKHDVLFRYLAGGDSEAAVEKAGQWIYANYAAWAYASYLRNGPGFLVGPIVADKVTACCVRKHSRSPLTLENASHSKSATSQQATSSSEF